MSIDVIWGTAQRATLEGGALSLPAFPQAAGIYCFRITDADGTSAAYVGETDNLRRRMTGYRNPGPSQLTNQRMHQLLLAALATAPSHVEVSIVTRARITVNGTEVPVDFGSKIHRRLLESVALVEVEQHGVDRMLNL